MHSTKTTKTLIFATVLALTASGAGWAASFSDIDTDGDELISEQEFIDFFGPKLGAAALNKYDVDDSGDVTNDEVMEVTSPEGFENSTNGMRKAAENQAAAAEKAATARETGQSRAAEARDNRGGNGRGSENKGRGRPGG